MREINLPPIDENKIPLEEVQLRQYQTKVLATTPSNPTGVLTMSPTTIIVVSDAIKRGNTIKNACQLAGLTTHRYYEIMRDAKNRIDAADAKGVAIDEESIVIMFYRAVKMAEAILQDAMVDTWYNLRNTDYKAARDFLARRFPEEWSETKNKNVKLSGPGGGPIEVASMDLSKLSIEELEHFEQLLSKVPQPRDDTDGEG